MLLFSPIHASCPAHLIIVDLIILIIQCEEFKSRSSSLCIFSTLPSFNEMLRIPSLFLLNLLDSWYINLSSFVTWRLLVRLALFLVRRFLSSWWWKR
jgi:hypothetical protein